MKQYRKTQQISSIILLLVFFCSFSASARIIYVDDDATGSNDGSSWENAYIYLQDALYKANFSENPLGTGGPIEIRVAQGVYTPDKGENVTSENKYETFELLDGVTISGGYAGYLPYDINIDPDTRDIELYQSILNGDLYNNDSNDFDPNNMLTDPNFSDNSINVVLSYLNDTTSVLDGFTITAGIARGYYDGDYYNDDWSCQGGGINIELSNGGPIITNCTFTINAAFEGGAIYCTGSDPNISNCKFIKNSANYYYQIDTPVSGYGGAIYNNNSSPILTNCEFIENLATYGSGIYDHNNSNAVITNCILSRNIANVDCGGGIYNYMSNPIVKDCNFSENYAIGMGGGIYNTFSSNFTLINCNFNKNQAGHSGGAIFNNEYSEPNITNCIFTGNSAGTSGGAIENEKSNPSLKNCIFSGNHALYSGAFDNSSGNPTFSSCVFSNNSADKCGGVIHNFQGNSVLKNCIFSGNTAGLSGEPIINTGGGAVFNVGGNLTFINCTANGNSAHDSGLFAHNKSVKLPPHNIFYIGFIDFLNCIIWNGENAILNEKDSIVEINYSDVQNGLLAIDDPQQGLTWGNGNIDAEPLFVESGFWIDVNDPNIIVEPDDPNAFWLDGDYHLKSTAGHYDPNSQTWIIDDVNSPCIDTGDPNSPFTNEPLPNGNRINMGAYGDTIEASMSPGEALVAHWALDEIDGVIAYDSASDNHAIVNEPQWTEGKIDGALRLNGLRSYLDCGDSRTLGTRQMAIAMWLKPSHMGGMRYILSRAMPDLSVIDYTLMRRYEENIEFEIGQDNTESLSIVSNNIVPVDQWTHIAITLNGSVISIYINGQLDSSVNYGYRTTNQNYNLRIGANQDGTKFYHGILDDIRFYNIALNHQQIELLAR